MLYRKSTLLDRTSFDELNLSLNHSKMIPDVLRKFLLEWGTCTGPYNEHEY